MFAKLLKYEWRSSAATLGIASLAVLGASVLGGCILRAIFDYGDQLPDVAAFGLSMLVLFICLGLLAYMVAIHVLLLVRFYKNKFTDEGYLTFTLPVTSHQILLSSALNMLLWTLIGAAVLAVSVAIIVLIGNVMDPISEVSELVSQITMDQTPDIRLIPLYLLQMVVSLVYTIIISLTCLTVGSVIAKKHKILASFGIYYGISMISSTLGGIATLVLSMENSYYLDELIFYDSAAYTEWYYRYTLVTILIGVAVQLVLIIAGYISSTYLMKRELNLS